MEFWGRREGRSLYAEELRGIRASREPLLDGGKIS
jgi:hypothetical protein